MCGKQPDRKSSSGRRLVAAALAACFAASAPARAAEGLWDTVLEKMNVKAPSSGPAPDFVERTRPDPAGLGYLPTALPHKVSPVPVKSAAEVETSKGALDTAKVHQLDPRAPKPLGPVKVQTSAKAKPDAVAD